MIQMEEQGLREENYQLKNEITDLKNAFDLNREILRILSNYNHRTDPQLHLLMQIINRLTNVNNQSMLNGIDHIQHRNVLKQENLRLNHELNRLDLRLEAELKTNQLISQPNESKMVMQEQFASLSKELIAANEERIVKEHEIQYWKEKYMDSVKLQANGEKAETGVGVEQLRQKIKRKYTSKSSFKYEILNKELEAENRKLKQYSEQLQNRLLIFIKAYNLEDEVLDSPRRQPVDPAFSEEREEIRLLKYALNNIQVELKEEEYILTITQRFKEKDTMNNEYFRHKRSSSWPKKDGARPKENYEPQREQRRMEERYY